MNKERLTQGLSLLLALAAVIGLGLVGAAPTERTSRESLAALAPAEGLPLEVSLGELPQRLVTLGVIDEKKWQSFYSNRGGAPALAEPLVINRENASYLLNLFWALGLANDNPILTAGPMATEGKTGNFASTGGWTLSVGEAMDHYAAHPLITLTPEQQQLVEKVSQNIYRPCCGNSAYFPDCNHGMAILGLITLGASQGFSEEELYELALAVHRYWFTDTYLVIAQYLKQTGRNWQTVSPKELLGREYSSATGFAKIKEQVVRIERNLGASCGV